MNIAFRELKILIGGYYFIIYVHYNVAVTKAENLPLTHNNKSETAFQHQLL